MSMIEKRIIILKSSETGKPGGFLSLISSGGKTSAELKLSGRQDVKGNIILILEGDCFPLNVIDTKSTGGSVSVDLGSVPLCQNITALVAVKCRTGLIPIAYGFCGLQLSSADGMAARAFKRFAGDIIIKDASGKLQEFAPQTESVKLQEFAPETEGAKLVGGDTSRQEESAERNAVSKGSKQAGRTDAVPHPARQVQGGARAASAEVDINEEKGRYLTHEKVLPQKDIYAEETFFKAQGEPFQTMDSPDIATYDPLLAEDTTLSGIDLVAETDYYGGADIKADTGIRAQQSAESIEREYKEYYSRSLRRETGDGYGVYMGYYDKVKDKLLKILSDNQREDALTDIIPESYFVRVYFGESKYYCVGLVKSGDEPVYICYGVPAMYSKEPPEEFEGLSRWIPMDISKPKEKGYFMMFQSVHDGKCVNTSE